MERFAKIVNGWRPLAFFVKFSILHGSEYVSVIQSRTWHHIKLMKSFTFFFRLFSFVMFHYLLMNMFQFHLQSVCYLLVILIFGWFGKNLTTCFQIRNSFPDQKLKWFCYIVVFICLSIWKIFQLALISFFYQSLLWKVIH